MSIGRYGGSRWKSLLAGPQASRKASPGSLNRGEGKLAGALLKIGTPQLARKQYTGAQNPASSPGILHRMKMGGAKIGKVGKGRHTGGGGGVDE